MLLPGVIWCDDPYEAADGADLVVILTEWNEFRALDFKRLATVMSHARMADLCNIYSVADMQLAGFDAYVSVGRKDYSRG